jgi:hypothetical protein
MDIDHLSLDNTGDIFSGRDQLQEDTKDDDGVPLSRIYHPLLDGKFNLTHIMTDLY